MKIWAKDAVRARSRFWCGAAWLQLHSASMTAGALGRRPQCCSGVQPCSGSAGQGWAAHVPGWLLRSRPCSAAAALTTTGVCRYFLSRFRKVKKANGQILAINEVRHAANSFATCAPPHFLPQLYQHRDGQRARATCKYVAQSTSSVGTRADLLAPPSLQALMPHPPPIAATMPAAPYSTTLALFCHGGPLTAADPCRSSRRSRPAPRTLASGCATSRARGTTTCTRSTATSRSTGRWTRCTRRWRRGTARARTSCTSSRPPSCATPTASARTSCSSSTPSSSSPSRASAHYLPRPRFQSVLRSLRAAPVQPLHVSLRGTA